MLLSSHILAEAEALCESVTIIKDGRLVESGRLADMRHLAASEVTARLPATTDRSPSPTGCGPRLPVSAPELIATCASSVPREQVPAVLRLLADADAEDITCTPAKLEDLFLRHYEVAAR